MALLLELRPEEEQHIQQRARAEGVPPEDYVRRLVARDLERDGQKQRNQSAVALLDNWISQAHVASEEERREADEEWREAMRGVDRNRLSYRKRFPELATPEDKEDEAGGSAHS